MTITARQATAIRADRAAGMTYRAIADKHGLSFSTVAYHANPVQAEKYREKNRKRYAAIAADPEKRAATNRRQMERYYARKAEGRA